MNHSLSKDKIKVLLLEGVHPNAVDEFKRSGYENVELLKTALDEDDLIEKLQDVQILGIRSRTKVTRKVLEQSSKLMSVGCFCIGTNQVDLDAAKEFGIPVFNAPFSNTRSVAELVIGEAIMLARGVFEKSMGAHKGIWRKSAANSNEVRGKTLGIVGYGHIGTQVSVLAESLGMEVRYFDIEKKLAIGNAKLCQSLEELLSLSDIVTLHVPSTPQTKNMFGEKEFSQMKDGSYFINASRGNVVVIDALKNALESEKVLGAALDVFPSEPASNKDEFVSELRGIENVIMTPHVGGSTQEAQENIGSEVAEKLVKYSDNGSTVSSVNFPEASLPVHDGTTRFLHVHQNIPGVLNKVNNIFSSKGLNIASQYLQTTPEVGYVVIDIEGLDDASAVLSELREIEGTVKARILY